MTYALIVPPELLEELVRIRSETGISIRKQILDATWAMVRKTNHSELNEFIDNIEYHSKGKVKPWDLI